MVLPSIMSPTAINTNCRLGVELGCGVAEGCCTTGLGVSIEVVETGVENSVAVRVTVRVGQFSIWAGMSGVEGYAAVLIWQAATRRGISNKKVIAREGELACGMRGAVVNTKVENGQLESLDGVL